MGEGMRRAQGVAQEERRDANTYLAGRATDLAEQRRQNSERQLGIEEGLLGTDAQVSGQLGGPSQELLPYLGRYQFDANATALHTNAWDRRRLSSSFLQGKVDTANQLMQQAEDAARSGDFTTAERLRAQASSGLTSGKEYGQLGGTAGLAQIFTLVEDPATAARARLNTPEALMVGRQVQEAQQFQDFNSAASINERKIMSESGERSIAAAQRTADRQGRYASMAGGSAESAYGRQLGQERSDRAFGQDRAQLYSTVAQNFQTMQRQYAKDTVGFAQAFLQNQSGIRSDFQNALDSLKSQFATLSQQTAQMNQQMAQFQFQRQDAEQARSDARAQRYQDLGVSVGLMAVGALTGNTSFTTAGATKISGGKQPGSQSPGGDGASAILQAIMSGGMNG